MKTQQTCQSLAQDDSTHDVIQPIFDGVSPDALVCDTTLREMPDGSWVMVMLGGGNREPQPENRVFIQRSLDRGATWSAAEPIDLGVKRKNPQTALVPTELMVTRGVSTLFVATHSGRFNDWKEWMVVSKDSGRTWGELIPAPGHLHDRTFIRSKIETRDGRLLLPFQHYRQPPHQPDKAEGDPIDTLISFPSNGIMMSRDQGATWTLHGDIRLPVDTGGTEGNPGQPCWAENTIVKLEDDRIAMLIRSDGRGYLHYAESNDGGLTWPKTATRTDIPNPGSKATLYSLGGDKVALLHNPNNSEMDSPYRGRNPLSLWVSLDGLKTWPYRRILVKESCDGPTGNLNYPDGFVDADGGTLNFAFDDNRHRAVLVKARLPRW